MSWLPKIFSILYVIFLIRPTLSVADQLRVIRVTDGDTIKAVADNKEIIVRLAGIDAAETSKAKKESVRGVSEVGPRYVIEIKSKPMKKWPFFALKTAFLGPK